MIRKFKIDDIDQVMKIWLDANMQAHPFVQEGYWARHYDEVKQMLPQATIYVYEKGHAVQGFIGLQDHYIAGIFIDQGERSKGIGKKLLDYVKHNSERLTLQVYQKNARALQFYQRERFIIQTGQMDEDTGEIEFVMLWER